MTEPNPTGRRSGWLPLAATVLLTLLGGGSLAAAAVASTSVPAGSLPSISPSPRSSPTIPTPIATIAGSGGGSGEVIDNAGVADLVDPDWMSRVAAAGNIPERALAAYAGAAIATDRARPECGLGWNTLAAIGHVESEHGTIGGSRIRPDGVAAPTIIGIPLDGTETETIRDTDRGEVDGDPVWDRAVGPMQFIPETWKQYAQDGNGDGTADINQIDDAALTAAVYLCTAGGDLTVAANWIAAINAYNPSIEYNNRVAEAANHYATLR